MSIQRFSANVVSQVQSSFRITSLGDVVLGLLENCLTAEAGKIHVSLDLGGGSCTVEDDGLGIAPSRLVEQGQTATNASANQDQTNKELCAKDCTFLTSVAALSIITITSKHHQHYSQNSLIIQHGITVDYQQPHPPVVLLCRDRGATVTVSDLFGCMPVRIKQRNLAADARHTSEHQWLGIRKKIIALLLAKDTSIALTVREVGARSRILLSITANKTASSRDRIVSLLCLAAHFPHDGRATFVPVTASTSGMTVKGSISTTPAATKASQFISIDARPCDANHGHHILFETIKRLFDCSDFGLESGDLLSDEMEPRRHARDRKNKMYEQTRKHSKKLQKEIDRWPVFYLCIETEDSGKRDDVPSQELVRVVECLVHAWLEKHHFRPRELKHKKHCLKDGSMGEQQISGATTFVSERPTTPSADWSHIRGGKSTLYDTARQSRRLSPMFELAPLNAGQFSGARKESVGTSDDCMTMTILEPPAHQSSMSPAQPSTVNTVSWRNFITGETLQVDSRTGMIKTGDHGVDSGIVLSGDTAVSRSGRPLLLRKQLVNKPAKDVQSSLWMEGIMHDWSKSRFPAGHSDPIPTVQPPRDTCQSGCHHGHANTGSGMNFEKHTAVQLLKSDLREARVIAQVDQKYILAILGQHDGLTSQKLVMIDQHAASERCILEGLLNELCSLSSTKQTLRPPVKSKLGLSSKVNTVKLTRNLTFEIPSSEHSEMTAAAPFLAQWGILYNLDPSCSEPREASSLVTVISLPPGIVERCTADPKLIERLMRDEARDLQESTRANIIWVPNETAASEPDVTLNWARQIGACPNGIVDLLSSRACRSAVMFNDLLSLRDCEQLVGKLARCAFPFICAHGRVSMEPLVDVGHHFEGSGWLTNASDHSGAADVSIIDAFARWKANRLGSEGRIVT